MCTYETDYSYTVTVIYSYNCVKMLTIPGNNLLLVMVQMESLKRRVLLLEEGEG